MSEEQKFIERARQSLDAHAEQLEPRLAAQLRSARQEALDARRRPVHRGWMPALAAASLAAVVVGVMWFGGERVGQQPELLQASLEHGATDFEILTRSEELELYEQLDFYYWLAQRDSSAG